MNLKITTLAERPELGDPLWNMVEDWPEFILHDPVGWSLIGRIVADFPEYVLVATDEDSAEENTKVVARAFSVPLALRARAETGLPDGGWDQVLLWAFSDLRHGKAADTVSAIEITVDEAARGRGVSGRMLAAMRDNARARGFHEVVAPVRPSAKHLEPATPIDAYAHRTREDGLPHDPWLRVHVRAGGVIEKIAHASMTVSGSTAQWREWTGLPFDEEGPVEVPGALVPVHCEPERGYGVYVEPNVWVRHTL
ncbi:N-acetyltransferase [Streptomyces sp. G44]|uniref:N-acetyltransferase n=1 Tax=Streptomyces sp. G44 TaxID=2807632 RepID=UPI00195FC98F|nr:N-acetyltransferase [Streptomyces sp. G44]MBM7170578.1 N-acetyltransferase [Streptomyces sp. G44]